jgi:hypothetical protein
MSDDQELATALDEISSDQSLSAREKIRAKAELMRNYRALTNEVPTRRYLHENRTSVGRVLTQSMARTAGRSVVRALFSAFKNG